MDMNPADRVRALRDRYGSHDKLARELGTVRQTVIRWEQGSQPSPYYREKLAEIDGGDPDDFLWPDSREPDPLTRLAEAQEEMAELLRQILAVLLR